jgi:hypothetical protein
MASKMLKGFIRLGIVTTLLTWVSVAVWHWKYLDDDIWLIEQHISPLLNESTLSNFGWPSFAAEEQFLNLSLDGRLDAASRYFEQRLKPLEEKYYFDELKDWMLNSSQLSLTDAPVDSLGDIPPFRRFGVVGFIIAPRLSYVVFSSTTLGITGLISVGLMFVIIVMVLSFRWVIRGFSGEKPG